MKITPRKNQVLIRPDGEQSRKSESGLVIPDNVEQETKAVGTVVAVGKDIKDIKKGQRVIFGLYAGEKIVFKEDSKEVEYMLLPEEDILAFMEK